MRYLLVSACLLFSAGCFGGGSEPTPVPKQAAATTAPSPAPAKPSAAPSPSPVAKPTPTPEAELTMVWVGNTDGEGVYLRTTPAMADRLQAYPDKTPLKIIDVDVDAEGVNWHHVRAPDGQEGYVPAQYTVTEEP